MIFDCGGLLLSAAVTNIFNPFLANCGNSDIHMPPSDVGPGITRYQISIAAVLDSLIHDTEYSAKAHC
jgi:hypothetical protein